MLGDIGPSILRDFLAKSRSNRRKMLLGDAGSEHAIARHRSAMACSTKRADCVCFVCIVCKASKFRLAPWHPPEPRLSDQSLPPEPGFRPKIFGPRLMTCVVPAIPVLESLSYLEKQSLRIGSIIDVFYRDFLPGPLSKLLTPVMSRRAAAIHAGFESCLLIGFDWHCLLTPVTGKKKYPWGKSIKSHVMACHCRERPSSACFRKS